METYAIFKGLLFFLIAIFGIPANVAIVGSLSWIACSDFKLLSVELIIWNLSLANAILVITRGLPAALFMLFGTKVNSDAGCKMVIYLSRISRGMAFSLTCLLSCVQCVTLIPPSSKWAHIKQSVPKYTFLVIFCLWLLYMMMEIAGFFSLDPHTNSSNPELTFNYGYCVSIVPSLTTFYIYGFLLFGRDLVVVGLMTLASTYILLVLFRHRKHVNNLRNPKQNSDVEIRAAKTVLSLVIMYILFFGVENTIWLYQVAVSKIIHPMISDVRHFFSICYTIFFPIFILVSNKKIQHVFKCLWKQSTYNDAVSSPT
ncbi:olfactory receptor class A-like protein 1 [Protopterus annectens]|uniref:olfactory receptor class A-like protein 1 n=1 Tax=Protopterus annectens TaxID=7888 RepID=UPI001CFB0564|nr:olfactory receptor class A-like protein 1 [Protopterus annectens]